MAKVVATEVKARELEPGDLFSSLGPEYWDTALEGDSVGERVYIRTHQSADSASDADSPVYRIEVVKSDS